MRCVIYLRVSTKDQAEKDLTEDGFSIAAQREACVRRIRDEGWEMVDEYVDKGESARSADRPQLRAMLARIAEDGDVDAVVVHKVDRLARNMEDHIAIRALLRRHGVALVSVTENLDETASGRLVEGIHALMAEFYSANLAAEVRKGMGQKAKLGGYPHKAPLGYLNVREPIGGRQVAHIVVDPERAPLVKVAFDLYATGEWTVERLVEEMAHRGLRNRGRDGQPPVDVGRSTGDDGGRRRHGLRILRCASSTGTARGCCPGRRHPSAVDAIVVAIADQVGGAVVLSSDPADLRALAQYAVNEVRVAAV